MPVHHDLLDLLNWHLARLWDQEDSEQDGDHTDASEEEEHLIWWWKWGVCIMTEQGYKGVLGARACWVQYQPCTAAGDVLTVNFSALWAQAAKLCLTTNSGSPLHRLCTKGNLNLVCFRDSNQQLATLPEYSASCLQPTNPSLQHDISPSHL